MYQPSQYSNSYFPYHRQNIEQAQDNKQGIVDNDLVTDVSRESLNSSRESPNQQQQQQQHTPTTNSPHFQSNDFDRTNYARHSNGASYNQDSSFSPQHNNNNNNNTMTFARSSERDQNMPPLIRAGDKTHAAHVSQVVKGERDRDMSEDEQQRSAQYLSANCVIFTYCSGDITKMVDDHFTRALSQSSDREHVPMSARNLPPSFWDCNWVGSPGLSQYSDHWTTSDPWHNYMAAQMAVSGGSYSAHQMYHNARSYSSLLLHSRRDWVEGNYSTSPYTSMTGLEPGMQGSAAKDLYWF